MVRKIRNLKLESRNARLDLEQDKKPTFVSIGQGLSVGYRRNKIAGTWVFRKADGKGGCRRKQSELPTTSRKLTAKIS